MNGLREALFGGGAQAFWTILVAAVANASCAILGCYLVLRRMSLLGDALSHAVLPGIVVGFVISGSTASPWIFAAAVGVGLLTAFLIHLLNEQAGVAEDASTGVVFTSLFALGVVMLVRVGEPSGSEGGTSGVDLDTDCVLYGLLDAVSLDTISLAGYDVPRALLSLSAVLALTVAFVALFWKELKIVSFDPQLATALGLRGGVVHYLLMAMVALAIVAAFEAVGSVLVIAMLVLPAVTGHLLSDRLLGMMAWSLAVALVSAVLAYVGDVYFGTGMAPMMALVAGAQFMLALVAAPRHGLVSRGGHRLALAVRIAGEDIIAMLYRGEEGATEMPPAGVALGRCLTAAGRGPRAWLAVLALVLRGQLRLASGFRVALTEAGRQAARSLVRSHRLWEAYLGEHFHLPLDHLHEPAERIEHYIGPGLQEQLASALARPGTDPHGKEIPESH
jgi:manganese/zinc/iron transport system permease protein